MIPFETIEELKRWFVAQGVWRGGHVCWALLRSGSFLQPVRCSLLGLHNVAVSWRPGLRADLRTSEV